MRIISFSAQPTPRVAFGHGERPENRPLPPELAEQDADYKPENIFRIGANAGVGAAVLGTVVAVATRNPLWGALAAWGGATLGIISGGIFDYLKEDK